jgi:plastocyanin
MKESNIKTLVATTVVLMPLILVSTGFMTTSINTLAQTGSMATLQNIDATYAIGIVPGAAQRDAPYHYYPPAVSVPVGTTVAWFNNDPGQPHTVTSGNPASPQSGEVFNSGIMPATANSFFQYTFDRAGDYPYHCEIHPWRVAIVSASDAIQRGDNFELSSGVGFLWNFSKDFRTLLNIKPITVPLDRTTPLTYNITILENGTNPVFSNALTTSGEELPLELIRGTDNETRTYGPDFSSTGAYHIEGPFLKGNTDYTILVELTAINSRPPDDTISDEFTLSTVV